MQSVQYYLISLYLKYLRYRRSEKPESVEGRRKLLDKVSKQFSLPKGTKTSKFTANGVPAEWITFENQQPEATFFYLHGGAYNAGSLQSHRHLVANIAKACNCDAIHVDYSLAPEHPFPSAINDALSAYKWLLQQPERQIIVSGDSAGGGLAMALILKLKEENLPLPKCAILLAPWVDLTCTSETIYTVAKHDAVLSKEMLTSSAEMYTTKIHHTQNPLISPIFGDFTECPPVFIQIGTHDLLLGDAKKLEENLKNHGVEVKLKIWPNMPHIWQFFVGKLPEANKAINEIRKFIKSKLSA